MKLINVTRIAGEAPHSAFTDLVRFRLRWYCVFREASDHTSLDGKLRILESADGLGWIASALFSDDHADLRDPKLSITHDGRLMLLAVAAPGKEEKNRYRSQVWFLEEGPHWTEPQMVGEEDWWLWRVSWHHGMGLGVGYHCVAPNGTRLYRTTDGVNYEIVMPEFHRDGDGNETSIVFQTEDDAAICLLRRDESVTAQVGVALPPYENWTWRDCGAHLGGPALLRLPDGRFIAGGRRCEGAVWTSLNWLDPHTGKLTEFLRLPSGGDTSYPGLAWHEDTLWVSYYSSHEGKTMIYLARARE